MHIIWGDSDYTLCGRYKGDVGAFGSFTQFISEKSIDHYKIILCKSCIKIHRKKKGEINDETTNEHNPENKH